MNTRDTRQQILSTTAPIFGAAALVAIATLAGCGSGSHSDTGATTIAPPISNDAEVRALVRDAERANDAGNIDKASELYRRALSLDPTVAQAWNNLGEILATQGIYDDAVSAFRNAADADLSDPRPLYNAGVIYQQRGWAHEAHDLFLLALDRDPRDLGSLRGSVRSAELLGIADGPTLERIRLALLIERDERWLHYFQRRRSVVEAQLDRERAAP